ncbi:MAG: 30S ribosomal protein S3 [Planctomycetota bacterium]|nr:MAG: 30S ribosomal protein S3 [Planctomycetota bacterium]
MQKDDREKRKKGGDKQGKEPSQEKGEQKKVEEQKRRKAMIFQGFRFAGIPRIEIERFSNVDYDIDVRIFVARPAVIIGAKGQKIELLTQDLETITGKKVRVRVEEVKEPAKNAQLVAENIAEQLEKRAAFRRSMKKAIELAMAPTLERSSRSRGKTPEKSVRVEGIKIQVSGRLGGAEMARTESISRGKIPLQTLRADIDYGFAEAATTYGNIGVKVWIYKGDIISSEEDLYAAAQKS